MIISAIEKVGSRKNQLIFEVDEKYRKPYMVIQKGGYQVICKRLKCDDLEVSLVKDDVVLQTYTKTGFYVRRTIEYKILYKNLLNEIIKQGATVQLTEND